MHYFYSENILDGIVTLSPEESEHCIRVMRHRAGDVVRVTDGLGNLADATIIDDNHKKCQLQTIELTSDNSQKHNGLHLAIAPTKNVGRIEWLLEKSIEIGIKQITFINCDHSERTHLNLERLKRLAVSALKQSQTTWLPSLSICSFSEFIDQNLDEKADKFIAWCDKENTVQLTNFNYTFPDMIVLIGPEGDFSAKEIAYARENGYVEVKLGNRRLRTETAGLFACFAATKRNL